MSANIMTACIAIQPTRPAGRLFKLLCNEFAPFPGRMNAVWRYVLSSAIVILVSMTLRVPLLSFSLIMTFFTAQENTVSTKQSGLVLAVGSTVAVTLAMLLFKLTMDYPLLRILGAAAIAFCGMYFLRISKLGAIGYLVALLIFNALSIADMVADPEQLTRLMLWVWVAALYPIVITVTVNQLFLPAHPGQLLRDEISRQLADVSEQLEALTDERSRTGLDLGQVERGVLTLHRHLSFAIRGDKQYQDDRALHLMRISTVDRLHTAAARISRLPVAELNDAQRQTIGRLQLANGDLREAVMYGRPFALRQDWFGAEDVQGELDVALRDMAHALHALAQAERKDQPAATLPTEGLVAADAFTNPIYAQFATKTLIAAFLCYVFYTSVQWPGINTCMITCVIMALPTLGATSHKGILRVSGCILGSIIALVSTVFIVPHLDSITGLLLLTLPVIGAAAWIAAGSARTSYIGVQLAYAFALALLGGFGPITDVTEIRDRLIGILVGFFVSILVFSVMWPEREGSELLRMLAKLVRGIADLAKAGRANGPEAEYLPQLYQLRLQGWSLLTKNREMQARVALEPGWRYAQGGISMEIQTWFAQAQEALFAVNWLQTLLHHAGPRLPERTVLALDEFRAAAAARLDELATAMVTSSPVADDPLSRFLETVDSASSAESRAGSGWGHIEEVRLAAHVVYERISQLNHQPHGAVNQIAAQS